MINIFSNLPVYRFVSYFTFLGKVDWPRGEQNLFSKTRIKNDHQSTFLKNTTNFRVWSRDLIIVILLIILQVSFIPFLFSSPYHFNLVLVVIIFMTVIISYHKALVWSVFAGLLLDLYSSFNFGLIACSFFLVVLLVNFLFNNFFTNRSLYSLLSLGFIGVVIWRGVIFTLTILFYKINFSNFKISLNAIFFTNLLWQIFLSLSILILLFLSLNFLSKRLKSSFLKLGSNVR